MLKHSRKKKNNRILLIIVIAVLLIGGLVYLSQNTNKAPVVANPAQVDSFAQCLADKGVKMYGAEWCPHCKEQKEMFGESFAKIEYVECTIDQVKCNIAGIKGYPTWIYQ